MAFVPTPPRETASPQAGELATRRRALIDEYRRVAVFVAAAFVALVRLRR